MAKTYIMIELLDMYVSLWIITYRLSRLNAKRRKLNKLMGKIYREQARMACRGMIADVEGMIRMEMSCQEDMKLTIEFKRVRLAAN